MFLKHIEINGFKSFSDKIELTLSHGISAIVGPNGSGKSNIADAIRWVIGEQSAKVLRGGKMEDIIFSGSDKKKAANFAEVTLVLDNQDRYIDIDYNDISITRRMYRSGESEYYINKTQCRLKDIVEMLMDTGIGKDGYSIIGQGRIDEILSNRADDRRAIFEEAAGISKYKYRKANSEKKLKKTEENIIRIQDIIHEAKSQLEPLSKQAEITKKYEKLLYKLKTIEVNLMIASIDRSTVKLEKIDLDIKGIGDVLEQKNNEKSKLENDEEKYKQDDNNMVDELDDLNKEISNCIKTKDRIENKKNIYLEKILFTNENINRLKQEESSFNTESERLKIEIEENVKKLEVLDGEILNTGCLLAKMNQEYDNNYSKIIEMEKEIENRKQEASEKVNKSSEIKHRIQTCNTIINNIDKRLEQIGKDNLLLNQEHKEKLANRENIIKNKIQVKEELDKQKSTKELLTESRIKSELKIKNTEETLIKVRSKKDNVSSRLKVLEEIEKDYGGYNKTIKAILSQENSIKTRITGFKGVIGEIISVPEKWATAIEIALGATMQNIVTETEEDAKKMIGFLKENKLGRATFLPKESIKPRRLNKKEEERLGISGFVGIAADMVEYPKEYNDIIHYLLARIVIMDNIDSAIRAARLLNYSIKIVTIDGEVINVGGAITGGSRTSYSSGAIFTRRSQILKLKADYKKLVFEEEEFKNKLETEKIKHMQINKLITNNTEDIHNQEVTLNNINNQYEMLLNEIELLENKISINEKQIEEDNSEKREIGVRVGTDNIEMLRIHGEIDEHNKNIESLASIVQEQKDDKDNFTKRLTALKVKEAELKQQRNALENLIKNKKNENISMHEKLETTRQDIIEIEKHQEELYIFQNKMDQEIESINEVYIKKQNDYTIKKAKRSELKNKLDLVNKSIKQYQLDITELYESLHKYELQKAKHQIEIENNELKLLDSYEMSYNEALLIKIDDFNITSSNKQCEALKEEIRSLGTINANAVEEFKQLNERYIFLDNQLEDLKKAKEMLIDVIVDIKIHMEKQFLDELKKININFNKSFKSLFGGGTAEIILADKDNILESDIEIIAQPPNKKLQNLMLLSGGEKALTAIALLFGIFLIKPAPFCVLDEIDSALDDSNVNRYASYLKEFAKDSQFIIITHRKGSMEVADCLYGVSMGDTGISRLLSVRLEDKVS